MSAVAAPVVMYTTQFCPYCVAARRLFDHLNVAYEDLRVDQQPELRREMTQKSGGHTVPQIWVGGTHVGGCDELYALHDAGQLQPLLYPQN